MICTDKATVSIGSLDASDLRERTVPPLALLLAIVAAVGAWAYLPLRPFPWQQSLLLAVLASAALAAWVLSRAHPLAAGLTLLASQFGMAFLSESLLPGSASLFMFLAVAVSTGLAWPLAPLCAGAVAALVQLGLHLRPLAYPDLTVPAYLVVGAVLSVTGRISHDILRWSWRRHQSAQELSEKLRDRQGQLNATVKALDLAYRLLQRTNHELAEAREEADEARHLKEQFAANISHELRTPLNLIVGFSEMMYMSPDVYGEVNWTEPLRRDVSQVYRASRHLLQLVDDVLDLSRLNADHMPLRRQLCSLSDIITDVAATMRDLVREKPVSIRVEIDPLVPRLNLDATRIRQTLLNLVNNAIRFTDRGEIVIRLQRRESDVLLTVQDTGIGIPDEELESVFDEFYQTRAAATPQGGGMGLGLAISKRFVQMHGGRIWAESKLGVGSAFHISLPLDVNRPIASPLRISRPAPLPSNPYAESVLLLGGHHDVARVLERHLGNYRVLSASTPRDALQLLDEYHPRALIRNLTLRQIRQLSAELLPLQELHLPYSVPLLYCAIPCAAWLAEMLQAQGSLQKPVDRQQLLAYLHDLYRRNGPAEATADASQQPPVCDVLVADDDRRFVQVITRMLQGANLESGERAAAGCAYHVRGAYSGVEALAEMRRKRPDVLLLDVRMPELDGPAVLAAMRAEPALADVPTIIVTAMDAEEQLGGLESGLIAMAQPRGWRLGDTLKALDGLLQVAKPRYPAAGQEEPASGLPAQGSEQ